MKNLLDDKDKVFLEPKGKVRGSTEVAEKGSRLRKKTVRQPAGMRKR
ncbi:hypothetical protein ABT150_34160 [Streptomyces mirabilis]